MGNLRTSFRKPLPEKPATKRPYSDALVSPSMNAGRTTGTGPGKNREAANRLPADRPLAMVAGKRIEGTRREARPRPPASMGSGVSMKIFPVIFLARVRGALLAAIFLAASLGVAGGIARAQSVDLSTDQVTVDLSVIDGSGTGPAAAPFMTRPQGLAPRLPSAAGQQKSGFTTSCRGAQGNRQDQVETAGKQSRKGRETGGQEEAAGKKTGN